MKLIRNIHEILDWKLQPLGRTGHMYEHKNKKMGKNTFILSDAGFTS
jgi:hypothetical protein